MQEIPLRVYPGNLFRHNGDIFENDAAKIRSADHSEELFKKRVTRQALILKSEQELKDQIKFVSTAAYHRDSTASQIRMIDSIGKRYLKPQVVREILDETGNLKEGYPGNSHRSISSHGLHFMQKPSHPLMEWAIHSFFFHLGVELSPPSEIVRFEVDGEKFYPVLISRTVTGTPLKLDLENELTLDKKNQWSRWTWLLLGLLLTKPGDGRSTNYLLDPDQMIFSLNNNHYFVEPYIKGIFSRINFCSAIFTLFPDRPLDREVLEEFCSLNANLLLTSWIEDVIKKEAETSSIFSSEEKRRLFEEDPNHRFYASSLFNTGALATLNLQFLFLQKQLSLILKKNLSVTPINLLQNLIRLGKNGSIDQAPGHQISDAYLRAQGQTSAEKIQAITSRSEDEPLSSKVSETACFGRQLSFEEVENLRSFSSDKAKEELFANLFKDLLPLQFDNGIPFQDSLCASFSKIREGTVPNIEKQEFLLGSLNSWMRLRDILPISVTIQNCEALNSITLEPFLHDRLEHLDLRYCTNLRNDDLKLMKLKCPQLKTLDVSGCSNLTAIQDQDFKHLSFPHLTILHFGNCDNLEVVKLKSPCLDMVRGNSNPKLEKIDIISMIVPEWEFSNCPKIDLDMVENELGETSIEKEEQFCKEFCSQKEFMIEFVRHNRRACQYASNELKNDSEFMLEAILKNHLAIVFASEELKNNRSFMAAAIHINPDLIEYASEALKNDGQLISEAAKRKITLKQEEAQENESNFQLLVE